MFFWLSKLLWILAEPGNLFLIALVTGVILVGTRRRQAWGRRILALAVLVGLAVAIVPLGTPLIAVLEDRFPRPAILPDKVDGIVVLGGVVDAAMSEARGGIAIGGAAERLIAFAQFAHRYPGARLVFTGGSGDPFRQDVREARHIAALMALMGVAPERLILEEESRNTSENAVLSKRLAHPKEGETWLLVTSAFHMPRSMGCFRRAGWPVLAYPVDYGTSGGGWVDRLGFSMVGGFGELGQALHEWLGLAFYWLSGRTDALFPAP